MSYAQPTREERYVIAHLKMFKLSLREIARRLGGHQSTISREVKRNGRRRQKARPEPILKNSCSHWKGVKSNPESRGRLRDLLDGHPGFIKRRA